MKRETIFQGAGTAIVTPMKEDLSVNYDVLGDLIDFQLTHKCDAIVVTGTSGEASTLTDEEHIEVIRYTVDRVKGRIPVIAGRSSYRWSLVIYPVPEAGITRRLQRSTSTGFGVACYL